MLRVGSESVALRVDDEDDENEHDEAELWQSNTCEHQCRPGKARWFRDGAVALTSRSGVR